MAPRLILFTKAPLPGLAKTRLIPALGEAGAAGLARQLLNHAIEEATAAFPGMVELSVTPPPDNPVWDQLGLRRADLGWSVQGEGDLGERMARAARRALAGGQPVLLIGSDCPRLDRHALRQAASRLEQADMVIVPARDGGYVLLGLRRFDRLLFSDIAWSTDEVARVTLERAAALGWQVDCLPPLPDVDEPGDLKLLPAQFRPVPL